MQAILNKCQKSVASLNFTNDLENLIGSLSTADNVIKNEIENKIVKMGESAVDFLVDKLPNLKGVERGVVAMSLIRIGESAIAPLKKQADNSEDFGWIANYLISEINA